MVEDLFLELSMIIIVAVGISGIMKLLRQPIIIGYIITGILAGPLFLNIVVSTDMVATLSRLGVVFLLFIAGLSLNPKVMRSVGKVSVITGIGQVLFTTIVGFLLAKAMGFPDVQALYISIALTFSSTIIILKLLSDKGDMQTLYGRISVGFLIVQDVVAALILMIISSSANGFGMVQFTVENLVTGASLISFVALFGFFALPRVIKTVARSQEFLLLFSIGWLLAMTIIFGYLNFSMEIGALLAGIMLSVSPYHYEIKMKMNVLRDFFILFFFVYLGSQMIFVNIADFIFPIVVFSLFILVGNPLIVIFLMGMMRYTKRNSFLSGLTVAQISEFSLILVALGVSMGHISNDVLSMMTAIGLITIVGSTYLIMNSNRLYPYLSRYLSIFERSGRKIDEHSYCRDDQHEIILFGCNRLGFSLLDQMKNLKKKLLVVDNDPEIIKGLAKEGYHCHYGDADDPEFLHDIDIGSAKMIISTIPSFDINMFLLREIRKVNRDAIVIVVSHQIDEALKLYENEATYIVMPYFLGGKHASSLIRKYGMDARKFLSEKEEHMNHLKRRKRMKHEHPKAENHR